MVRACQYKVKGFNRYIFVLFRQFFIQSIFSDSKVLDSIAYYEIDLSITS